MTIHNHVILSVAKDLKVCVMVTGPTDCEILRYAQDDKPSHSLSWRGGCYLPLKEMKETKETKET